MKKKIRFNAVKVLQNLLTQLLQNEFTIEWRNVKSALKKRGLFTEWITENKECGSYQPSEDLLRGIFLLFPPFFPSRSCGTRRVRPLGVAWRTLTFAPVSTVSFLRHTAGSKKKKKKALATLLDVHCSNCPTKLNCLAVITFLSLSLPLSGSQQQRKQLRVYRLISRTLLRQTVFVSSVAF